jgi:hypothetical protein
VAGGGVATLNRPGWFLWAGVLLLAAGTASAPRVEADEGQLRRIFGAFMRSADEMRVEAVPDLYEGGYARISVTGRGVRLGGGMPIDEVAIRLVGVSLAPEALRNGTLRVLDIRDSALQVRVLLRSLQAHVTAGTPSGDIRLWAADGYLYGSGTVMLRERPTHLRMKGFFAVSGTTEVYFYFESLHAGGLPVPTAVVRNLERALNPIMHQRDWPITFKIRSVRLDAQSLTASTQGDGTCPSCGGGEAPALAP